MATKTYTKKLTSTDNTPRPEGRLRCSFGNSTECTHRWAANTQPHGRAGNVYFDDGVIYSYGTHFPMARHVKRKAARFILFTTNTYSSTTSGHKNDVERATRGQTVYRVPNVLADTREEHEENLKEIGLAAAKLAKTAERARSNRDFHLQNANGLIKNGNSYAAAVGLRTRLPAIEGLAEWSEERHAAEMRREKARKLALSKKLAGEVAEWEQKLSSWKDGGKDPGYCPDSSHPLFSLAFLRVRGTRLETSMRAVVPLSAVLPILAKVRSGEAYSSEGQYGNGRNPISVDGFELRSIDHAARLVTIGCHTVTFDEVERVAKVAGL